VLAQEFRCQGHAPVRAIPLPQESERIRQRGDALGLDEQQKRWRRVFPSTRAVAAQATATPAWTGLDPDLTLLIERTVDPATWLIVTGLGLDGGRA
jgi:hypothetical protein